VASVRKKLASIEHKSAACEKQVGHTPLVFEEQAPVEFEMTSTIDVLTCPQGLPLLPFGGLVWATGGLLQSSWRGFDAGRGMREEKLYEGRPGRGINLNQRFNISQKPKKDSATDVPITDVRLPPARNRLLLYMNGFIILFAFIAMMIMLAMCSPMRGAEMHMDDKSGEVRFTDGKLAGKLVQVALPYWLPVDRNTTGVLWLGLFIALLASCVAVGFLMAVVQFRLAVWCSPAIFSSYFVDEHTGALGLFVDPRMFGVCIFGAFCFPVCYLFWRNELRGRELQWGLLAFELCYMFFASFQGYMLTFASRTGLNWTVQRNADAYWHWFRTFTLINFGQMLVLSIVNDVVRGLLLLKWRRFMTNYVMERYFANHAYYLLNSNADSSQSFDNPDARIQTDVEKMIGQVHGFAFSIVSLVVSLIMQLLLVWSTVPYWIAGSVLYTMAGSGVALWITWQLTSLKYEIERREADWRFSMINLRNNAEAIALYQGERFEQKSNTRFFEGILDFMYRVIWWGAGLGSYTFFYNFVLNTVPDVLLTRRYFQGTLDYGGMGQIKAAFVGLSYSLNFILTHSLEIADVAVSVSRLGLLVGRLEDFSEPSKLNLTEISEPKLEVSGLAVITPGQQRELIKSLSLKLGPNGFMRMLVVGRSGVGKSCLLRCIAALWPHCTGSVTKPPMEDCIFLPQEPYMPLGNLRNQLTYPRRLENEAHDVVEAHDGRTLEMLEPFGLADLPTRFEKGWEHKDDWKRVFSLGEQQRIAAIRGLLAKPKLAVLDEATSALSEKDEQHLYKSYIDLGIPIISVGHRPTLLQYHDSVLEIFDDKTWNVSTFAEYEKKAKKQKLDL